jgi:NADH:ubiquinone oxidoreductase subunit B-like Fe-S oxidoreductase
MIASIKDKLLAWAEKDLYITTTFCGSGLMTDLISHLNSQMEKEPFIISDGDNNDIGANLIIISGFINLKNIELLKIKINKLNGPKYIITAGQMVHNKLNFPSYNFASIEGVINVDQHVYGPKPSRRDIVNAILRLDQREGK